MNEYQLFPKLPNYWAAGQWLPVAAGIMLVLLALLIWSWLYGRPAVWVRFVGMGAKAMAIVLIALILLEPMRSEQLPELGANLFLIMADDSQSLQIRDQGETQSRADKLQAALKTDTDWQMRLAQEFDTRRYLFDNRVRSVSDFEKMTTAGKASSLLGSLESVSRRYQGRPNAGILLLTDGNATDLAQANASFDHLPPVYPVVIGNEQAQQDIRLVRVTSSQTNFEAAPVTVAAEIVSHGYQGRTIVAQLLNEAGEELQQQQVREVVDGHPFALRFQVKPQRRGVLFYRIRVYAQGTQEQFEPGAATEEATLVNNTRLIMVDRAGGPYRILYVSGRPNWEFKFLRRALADDPEVNLVGLVRIAKREPKFTFRDRDERSSRLFNNSDADVEQVEQYDEPVLVRLGTKDKEELRGGFPQTSEELFAYHAVVIDDLEAEFFSADQKALLQQFVSQRGGGLLMLGGEESFVSGEFAHTPIGEMLPVYVDRGLKQSVEQEYRLILTREGWLEPWVRVRSTRDEEEARLSSMPPFKTVNQLPTIKPGARVLARVRSSQGQTHPALVVQTFGKGRSAALTIGDMWRWQLRSHKTLGNDSQQNDLEKAWRQTCRWLVAEVPQPIEVEVKHRREEPNQPVQLLVNVHDESYRPLDNATVAVKVTTPLGKEIELNADPVNATSGQYHCTFIPQESGGYRATLQATDLDASEIGQREVGWVAEPAVEEFSRLQPNRALLTRLAKETEGEVLELDQLDRFVRSMPQRNIPITKEQVFPVWHTWSVLLAAVGLLVTEWGLRRWKGLP